MKKRRLWTLVSALIAGLSIYAVFAGSNSLTFGELLEAVAGGKPLWLAASVVCMLGFIVFEALSLLWIVRCTGHPRSLRQGLLYSAGDIYFSAITPSASGGQPASILFMRMHGIPGAVITVALVLNLVMYTLAILAIGVVCLILQPEIFASFGTLSKVLILFGFAALSVLAALFYGLLKKGGVLEAVGMRIISALSGVRLMRNPDRWREKLRTLVAEYQLSADALSGKKRVLVVVFLLDLLQRASQIAVTPMIYYMLGGDTSAHGADLFAVQAFSQIGSNCVPVPGGMGVADYLMLDGFQILFAGDYAHRLELLSRGLSFYICTIVSGLIVLCGYLWSRKKRDD